MQDPQPIPWTAQDILQATAGASWGHAAKSAFQGVSIDSRAISEKDLFVAVKGERHDGHYFIDNAISKGVKGVIISRHMRVNLPVDEWVSKGIWVIAVENTIAALGDLARFQRRRAGIPVVAVTGSSGKTTTKELVAAVLNRKFNTLYTKGNLNNEIGLPLTLLRLSRDHQAAVVEMGMNHPGEISRLSGIALPDIGVITTIGPAHLEGLGTVEDVMAAKGEIRDHLKEDGWMVLNGDNPYCLKLGKVTPQKVMYFGLSEQNHIRGENIVKKGWGSCFTMCLSHERIEIDLGLPGRFMVHNALAAGAVGHILGISVSDIKAGIESVTPGKGRMSVLKTPTGIHVIDDTYNANPASMEAAIRTLIFLKEDQRGVLVAGDMLELGEQSAALHEAIGKLAAESGVSRLFLTGKDVVFLAQGARAAGMAAEHIVMGPKKEIIDALRQYLRPGDWVLVKGSRSMGMEEVVESLKDGGGD